MRSFEPSVKGHGLPPDNVRRARYIPKMAVRLKGVEFRVFHSLRQEWDFDTVEAIRVHLTQGPVVSTPQIEDALDSLAERGYIEEFEPGRWRISPQGHGVHRSLLGELAS